MAAFISFCAAGVFTGRSDNWTCFFAVYIFTVNKLCIPYHFINLLPGAVIANALRTGLLMDCSLQFDTTGNERTSGMKTSSLSCTVRHTKSLITAKFIILLSYNIQEIRHLNHDLHRGRAVSSCLVSSKNGALILNGVVGFCQKTNEASE